MKHLKIKIWLIVLLIAPLAPAAVHYVPADYSTIQAAVNACSPLDTVIVAPGTYKGSGNRDINLNGKTITLQSTNPADPLIVSTSKWPKMAAQLLPDLPSQMETVSWVAQFTAQTAAAP